MARFVLVRHGGEDHVLPESLLPSEARLHDALETHPELFPAEDLNLGQMMVVGREVWFESGAADLIYIDEGGQIVIVEVKKGTENADSRRVVAQMLDYGAHLWRMTFEDFESQIALPYLRQRGGSPVSLLDVATSQFSLSDSMTPDEFRDAVTANLTAGTFVYAVVARTLPPTLGTVLQYLSEVSRIQTVAVTVDYYRDGDRDMMVPHVAFVSPKGPIPNPKSKRKTTREQFLQEVGDAAAFWETLLDFLSTLPGKFYWGEKGFSYRLVVDGKQRSVIWGYPRTAGGHQTRTSDKLIVLVEANPEFGETARELIGSLDGPLRTLPGAIYKRESNDKSARVEFEAPDRLPSDVDASLRTALTTMFAMQQDQSA